MLNMMMLPQQMMMSSMQVWQSYWENIFKMSQQFAQKGADRGEEMADEGMQMTQDAAQETQKAVEKTAEKVNWAGQDALKAATEQGKGKLPV